jgi:hypothetical protein
MYADRVVLILKEAVMVFSKQSEEATQQQLDAWAAQGVVEIVKPLADAGWKEVCVKLLGPPVPSDPRRMGDRGPGLDFPASNPD